MYKLVLLGEKMETGAKQDEEQEIPAEATSDSMDCLRDRRRRPKQDFRFIQKSGTELERGAFL